LHNWHTVSPYPIPRALLPALLTGILALLLPGPVLGVEITWGLHPDRERVVLKFATELPQELPERTGPRELSLVSSLPEGETPPSPFTPGRSTLIDSLKVSGSGVILHTTTAAFGYLSFTLPGESKLVVDLFPSELGSRWTPEMLRRDSPPETLPAPEPQPEQTGAAAGDGAPPTDHPTQSESEPAPGQNALEPNEGALQAEPAQAPSPAQIRGRVRQVGPGEAEVINPHNGSPGEASLQPGRTVPADRGIEARSPGAANLEKGLAHLDRGEWAAAAARLEEALAAGLTAEERENAAYGAAEALYRLSREDTGEHFERMIRALQRAMNTGPGSPRYPWALFAAGDIQLRAGNLPEARAYFTLLRNRHPDHPDVPRSYLSWGEHHLAAGQWEKAAEALQTVVQEYPESDVVRRSAVALVEALKEGGFFDQAFKIATYVDRRWPRYYMEDQEFLRLEGIIAMETGNYELARSKLWKNYNLVPEAPGADLVIARLGDIYLLEGRSREARQTYEIAATRYPDAEGGLIAAMRLAERGIFDQPSVDEMFVVFDRPEGVSPKEIYTRIADEYPDTPLGAVAQLKLAMWLLFDGQLEKSIEAVALLRQRPPAATLWPRALEVAGKAFEQWVEDPLQAGRVDEILTFWNSHHFLQETLPNLSARGQLAMALTFSMTGGLDHAQEISERVMEDSRFLVEERSTALGMFLTIAAERQQWSAILSLAERGPVLPVRPEDRSQLRYALALARENTGGAGNGDPDWEDLAMDPNLRPSQQGHAFYYLGRDAFRSRDMDRAYHLTERALSLFLRERREKARIMDSLDRLIVISERTGRTMKALEWAHEYERFLPPNDPEWPSFQYRLATLYRAGGDARTWQRILTDLKELDPAGVFGKMAAADLRAEDLQRRHEEFR
jgi:TolA-binding protein